jgi:hypothetical protein
MRVDVWKLESDASNYEAGDTPSLSHRSMALFGTDYNSP